MASIIDVALARTLIAGYQKQNSAPGGPALLAPNGNFLNGYFIDRESLDKVLSDPEVTGISIKLAKSPDFADSDKNIFTIIFVGAIANPDYQNIPGATPILNSGDVYDMVVPCPPICPPAL